MRIVITGGAGFLGSHLAELCLRKGHEVVAVDSLLTGSLDNLAHIDSPRFSFSRQNISDGVAIDGEVGFIFQLASPASPLDYARLPIETLEVGARGTQNVLELAREKNAGMLLASTSEIYGDPLVHPQPEEYWGNVNPIGPRSCYDEAKRFAEAMTMAYHRQHGIDTKIARIFNTYGPRMRLCDGRVVPNFIKQALEEAPLTIFGDGRQTRSFCYVEDLIEGLYRLAMSQQHLPVNIGNPGEFTMLELARLVQELTGTSSKIEFRPLPADDPKQRKPDISKAKQLLGWKPKIALRAGLVPTLEYFRKILT